jgi:heme-degrading monooxygenase HmoA
VAFVYVWEYDVRAGHECDFLAAYGPLGDWVALFRDAPGYVGTDLLRDRAKPLRFVTIDRWRDESDFRAFRLRAAAAFDAIDRRCEAYTLRERALGDFTTIER